MESVFINMYKFGNAWASPRTGSILISMVSSFGKPPPNQRIHVDSVVEANVLVRLPILRQRILIHHNELGRDIGVAVESMERYMPYAFDDTRSIRHSARES